MDVCPAQSEKSRKVLVVKRQVGAAALTLIISKQQIEQLQN